MNLPCKKIGSHTRSSSCAQTCERRAAHHTHRETSRCIEQHNDRRNSGQIACSVGRAHRDYFQSQSTATRDGSRFEESCAFLCGTEARRANEPWDEEGVASRQTRGFAVDKTSIRHHSSAIGKRSKRLGIDLSKATKCTASLHPVQEQVRNGEPHPNCLSHRKAAFNLGFA
jgi:hypothetical protein